MEIPYFLIRLDRLQQYLRIHPFAVTNNGVKGAQKDETPSSAARTYLLLVGCLILFMPLLYANVFLLYFDTCGSTFLRQLVL
jgi:hypothetical protein